MVGRFAGTHDPAMADAAVLLAFDHAPVPLYVFDEGGRLIAANAAARALGLEADVVRDAGPEDDLYVDHRRFAVETSKSGGTSVRALRDVTEHRATQDALAHCRRVECLGFVAASVAHDLSNLLTPVLCLGAQLEEELTPGTRPHALARDIRAAGLRSLDVVRMLVRFARHQPSRPQRIDVNAALSELEPLLRRSLPPDARLDLELGPEALEILADRGRLETAVLNLVVNARDALATGGSVRVVTSRSAPGSACITVSDDGTGMAPEILERAFDRFFTTKPAGFGTGLGLAAVQSFVVESGGTLSLHSELGRGTAVVITLPLAAGPA